MGNSKNSGISDACHDHEHCISDALETAQAICQEQGAKLTQLRKQVLLLIWQNHKPLGAYTLIDMLAQSEQRRVAPPTVYRALEFLLELGLIHRINSLNAYIGCTNPQLHQDQAQASTNYFFICSQCNDSQEIISPLLANNIRGACEDIDFLPQQQWLEVTGLCKQCR
ncbi:MAG: Fur family zinc uptake transcriptional regulator [Cellvibrionaceae bacterium]|jgi:Fur family zinc uptake transcriptional regulator